MQKIIRIISGTFIAHTTVQGMSVPAALPISPPMKPQVRGIKRMYASYRRLPSGDVDMTVLTAVYSDPLQLERFVVKVGPNRPLILFSHQLALTRA